jgi:hypothetical protein
MTRQRTITLTGRAPVRILEDEWPLIAQSDWEQVKAPREARAQIRVRRHADGRTLVYGIYRFDGPRYGERRYERAGVLCDSSAGTVEAIEEVAAELEVRGVEGWEADWGGLEEDCVGALPAEVI